MTDSERSATVRPAGTPAQWTPTPLRGVGAAYREHLARLLSVARKVAPMEDAEDIVHDALIRSIQMVSSGAAHSDPAEQEPLLFGLVLDFARDRKRRSVRRARLSALITGPTAAMRRWVKTTLPSSNAEIDEQIRRAVAKLPRRCAEVFLLVYDHDASFATAGKMMSIGEASARSMYARAIARLRSELASVGMDNTALRDRWDT